MSQNPPDNPFGSQPSDNPFGSSPAPPAGDEAWRASNQPQSSYSGPPISPSNNKADGATASLVLGIIGVVLCQLCAPFAWYMGKKAERLVDASGGVLQGRGEATAGKILGIVGCVLLVLAIIFVIAIVAFGVALESGSSSSGDFEF